MALDAQKGVRGVQYVSIHYTEAQLDGKSHRPWMNITGVAVVAFARSICSRSRSEIAVGATAWRSSGAFAGTELVIVDTPS